MNEHSEMNALMSLALDGLLTPSELGALEAHLQSCPACNAEWGRWKEIDALFGSEPAVAPSAQFSSRVIAEVQAQANRRRRLTRGAWLVGGSLYVWTVAAMAVGLAALLWVLSDPMVVVVFARVLTKMLAAAGLLAKAMRLALFGLVRREVLAVVMSYACLLSATVVMWVRMVRLRDGRNMATHARA